MTKNTLIGPFTQLLTMQGLPEAGPISDSQLQIIEDAGVLCREGGILEVGLFDRLSPKADTFHEVQTPCVALPGFIDSHTHICYAGSRSDEYAQRLEGSTYQEIASEGGGILNTVKKTRQATEESLIEEMATRCQQLFLGGITTCEVKSGYGLTIEHELKMLRAIQKADAKTPISLIPTCLAAHICPPEYEDQSRYLEILVRKLFPSLIKEKLTKRIDIFIEKDAFTSPASLWYLSKAKDLGFQITCHADQFSRGGSLVAAQLEACSADHLEQSGEAEALALAKRGVVGTVLPGATLGLGMDFAPARMLLDKGVCLAIASDWNPGSGPMGDLLTQAALLGASEKLTMAETLAGITCRAAKALSLDDRGILEKNNRADIVLFPCRDWREILYHQGALRPIKL